MMNLIYTLFGTPLGWLMWLCYFVFPSYVPALILFTVITKIILFPAAVKQQKSMAKMALFQPKLQEIQRKYANNREKLAEETARLQQEEGFSPYASCLPTLIQFPILFGLIDVIYKPLTHIVRLPKDIIASATEIATGLGATIGVRTPQLDLIGFIQKNPAEFSSIGAEYIEKITNLNLNFFGIDLTGMPQWGMNLGILIPIISAVATLAYSLISMKVQGNSAGNSSTKTMMFIMPIFSFFISFSFPLGIGLYWAISYVVNIFQQLILNIIWNPEKLKEQERIKQEELKKLKKERAVVKKVEDGKVVEKQVSQKEYEKQRLAEARRRHAEKYGDVYEEDNNKKL